MSAWHQTLPNFFANGRWYSNERFGVVAYGPDGSNFAVHRVVDPGPRKPVRTNYSLRPAPRYEPRRLESDPYVWKEGDPPTWDPVDWSELMPQYLRLRDHLELAGDNWYSDAWLDAYREVPKKARTGERM